MELRHVRSGSGPPLLLVHGIGHSLACWRDVVPPLAEAFECYAVDLPGFGGSPPPASAPTLRMLAETCAAFMAERGHDRFHVAGNSLGGGIALHLALDGVARSACALSPVGFAEGWERAVVHLGLRSVAVAGPPLERALPVVGGAGAVRRLVFAQFLAHGERVAVADLVDAVGAFHRAPAFAATARHALNWRCPAGLPLRCPVTVAWGEKDRLLLHGPQAARARERLPGARHVTLADTGHLPTLDDAPLVARVVRDAIAA